MQGALSKMTEINFKGKTEVVNHHLAVPTPVIVPKYKLDKKNKISELDSEGNLIIKGDNLLALKALLPTHKGRVKCIYIDPPYNTGNEGWCYNDNVNSPLMKDWFGKVVDIEDQTRHDKWLCMMYPRLRLLRELLSDDGVIFISIDDHEQHRLRSIMDEIFGEDNFEGHIHWRRRHNQPNDKTKMIGLVAEHILAYTKDSKEYKKSGVGKIGLTGIFSNPDNDPRGDWSTKPWKVGSDQSGSRYKITLPSDRVVDEEWMGEEVTFKKLLEDDRIIFTSGGDGLPRKKYFKSERQEEGQCATNWWSHEHFGHNQEGSSTLTELMDDVKNTFNNPKPVTLIRNLISIANCHDGDIILDSFAGSGTTGHATLALNKEDGGNRKFILIECEDYAEKTTAERVRRVIKGIPKSKNEDLKKGLDETFVYCELGDSIDYEKLLQGKMPPPYKALSALLFSQATGESLKKPKKQEEWLVGETAEYKVYVIYKPDVKFLESNKSMLTLDLLKKIKKSLKSKQRAIVFASGRYVDSDDLKDKKVLFCHIPYELHRA